MMMCSEAFNGIISWMWPSSISKRANTRVVEKREQKEKRFEKERRDLLDLAVILFQDIKSSGMAHKNAGEKALVELREVSKKDGATKTMNDVVLLVIKGFGENKDSYPIEKIPKELFSTILLFLELKEQVQFASLSKRCSSLVVKVMKIDLYFSKIYQKHLLFSNFITTASGLSALRDRVECVIERGALGAYMCYVSPLGFFLMGLTCAIVLSNTDNRNYYFRWISLADDYCEWKNYRMNELMSIPQKYKSDPILSKNRCCISQRVVRFPIKDKEGYLFESKVIFERLKNTKAHPITGKTLSLKELVFDQALCIEIHKRLDELEQQKVVI